MSTEKDAGVTPRYFSDRTSLKERSRWQSDQIDEVITELSQIRAEMLNKESAYAEQLKAIPSERHPSIRNLLHYIALRSRDITTLQLKLARLGLSSLGRCESSVIATIDSVLSIMQEITGKKVALLAEEAKPVTFSSGRHCMEKNTKKLLGEPPETMAPAIMVTMPATAADDYSFVRDLVDAGMNIMRVNCAHDNRDVWLAMIDNLRKAERELGRHCRVAMDLCGPKIRTAEIEPGPNVLRWKPKRDELGRVILPARIWISFSGTSVDEAGLFPQDSNTVLLPATGTLLPTLNPGDRLRFTDTRGRNRVLAVTAKNDHGVWAESSSTAYVIPGIQMHLESGDNKRKTGKKLTVGNVPAKQRSIVLRKGDLLTVTNTDIPGHPARYNEQGKLLIRPSIGCTLPEIFKDVQIGHRILFDDGKIAGLVVKTAETHLVAEIIRAQEQGDRLQSDKGINLPDTELHLPALTKKDIEDLEFIARHADIVNYSFVRRREDLEHLAQELRRLNRTDIGIVLKIENRQAVDNLPMLLTMALRSPASGVMIARGDLAVECGWERLAEVQEEILWMCEAAHMPVIWATQVLEGLAKRGLPSRAEISDAAMGARAECVMLNKGPNIVGTVRCLRDILSRMHAHQVKKRSMFRRLEMVDSLLDQPVEN
ncbi:pyruvate kinase [Desulfobacter sp.]|uniref:pyruvate kinase n=1 Tax=Desulfobacter sp. TaxID=2294 RepID=UPI00257E4C27|nr:pyruvate kinase [Desulfobacter sp.]